MRRKSRDAFLLLSFCVLLAFVYLFICSPNSPIYVFNDIHDTNWFITMGRGILNGKVPYKDLFEQKGPLLYLIYAVCCLFNNVNIGIFILELIANSLFLFVSFKILKHYLNDFLSVLGVIFVVFLTFTSFYRVLGGGAVEELCLPAIAYAIFLFVEFLENKKMPTCPQSLLLGVSLAFIFWTKFTILTTVAPILIAYFIISIVRKQHKQMFASIGIMSGAFVAISLVPIVYLAINGALKDMLYVYFYLNIFAYGGKVNLPHNLRNYFCYGPLVTLVTIVGFIVLILNNKSRRKSMGVYVYIYLTCLILLLVQKGFKYYYISLIPFAVVAVAALLNLLNKNYATKKVVNLVLPIVLIATIVCSCFMSYTTTDLFRTENDYPQLVVAKEIKQISQANSIKDPTLFCYKIWDYGFYTASDILPNAKYFANNVIEESEFSEMYEGFRTTIQTAAADFVVTTKEVYLAEKDFLTSNYTFYQEYAYGQNSPYKDVKLNFVLLVRANINF